MCYIFEVWELKRFQISKVTFRVTQVIDSFNVIFC